ncbi:hypothetical protein [Deinococcus sp. Marseille-Q6407]|uniref:hypothetical protein n=1 Tax=Deinococcus sp. Marseille-Q6407 TaxID=2969223 RepID=UPI0021BE1764|nr:hypothetical protein [Deinococcus sp. Marseille-Q6407]
MNSWQTWLFRAGHQVDSVTDENYGSHEVRFVLRPGEDVAAVHGCARSFDKQLMSEGMYVYCIAYASATEAQQAKQGGPFCERGRAIQQLYSSGARAEVFLNPEQGCTRSPRFLPDYARTAG